MYGILLSSTNTGLTSELLAVFTAPLSLIDNRGENIADALNLKRRGSRQTAQRWEIEAGIAPTRADSSILVHTVKYGHVLPFPIRMPQPAEVICTTAAVTVNGTIAAGNDTFNINGAPSLVSGEFINIGADPKVYLVVSPGVAGVGVQVSPPLRTTISTLSVIKTNLQVTMQAMYDKDTRLGITYVDGVLSDNGIFKFIERL